MVAPVVVLGVLVGHGQHGPGAVPRHGARPEAVSLLEAAGSVLLGRVRSVDEDVELPRLPLDLVLDERVAVEGSTPEAVNLVVEFKSRLNLESFCNF